ncbi:hypothetical protein OJAV_G00200190 [Oryzias javanicus]|uniref:Ig-like domain-containing protein n=1 Tax=Oryzias javanicus TaxID=123683 RepID=A0A3S2PE96_ORYJA|nr:hypothetical protein OJAV_G00200190 [Oryzias javanicus]
MSRSTDLQVSTEMKDTCRILMAALSVNMLTVYMFLSVFFLPGVLAQCDLIISAPKKQEALIGSCLLIPCSIESEPEIDFFNTREPLGAWFKDTKKFLNPKYFERRMKIRRDLLFITGNLKQKNCTTLISNVTTEHSNTYYFGIMRGPVSKTAECYPLDITVKDSPPSPSIEVSADLKEKTSVSITCSAPTPCPLSPPELTWNLQPDSQRQTETNTDGSFTTKIQKNITLSDTHDGFTIRCSARYPVNEGPPKTAETLKTLSVSYAPKNTSASISPSGSVSTGNWAKMTCSSRAKPAVINFSWFRSSKDGDQKVAEGETYSLNPTEGGAYYCVATNDLGNQTSPKIDLIVGDTKQSGVVFASLKILGVLMLCATIIIFECWFHCRFSNKSKKDSKEEVFENVAMQTQTSEDVERPGQRPV